MRLRHRDESTSTTSASPPSLQDLQGRRGAPRCGTLHIGYGSRPITIPLGEPGRALQRSELAEALRVVTAATRVIAIRRRGPSSDAERQELARLEDELWPS